MNKEQARQSIKQSLEIHKTLECGQALNKILRENFNQRPYIAIYGAGNLGQQLFALLKKSERKVDFFLDQNAKEGQVLLDVPVYTIDNSCISNCQKEDTTLILAIFLTQKEKTAICKMLNQQGYEHIVDAYTLLGASLPFKEDTLEQQCYEQEKDKIFKVLELLADDHSRDIYCSNLKAHGTYDYDNTLQSEGMTQYFDVKIPFHKGYSRFVDCGAYTGDSLQTLLKYHTCDTYIGFEPDKKSFDQLSMCLNEVQEKMKAAYLYPCAVSNEASFRTFSAKGGGASSLSTEGTDIVQTVQLDDVLKVFEPTMIKMDIEGAETAALFGAKNIITKYKPDLAICVYHKVADLWEIPLLLHEWIPQYKLYLRCHYFSTIETVLYATL